MTNNVIVVTQPDDIQVDAYRILLVGLDAVQSKIVSDALLNVDYIGNVVLYHWEQGPADWFLDKKHKSDLIIFNADNANELVVGYLAAHKNAHYFGTLKFLAGANPKAIYSVEDLTELFTLIFKQLP